MKKNIYTSLLLTCLFGCSNSFDNEEAKNIPSTSIETSSTELESFIESMGDSVLPYFDFDEEGNRIEYLPNKSFLAKSIEKKTLVLDSIEEYYALESEYAERISTDHEYSHSIARPLDYNCQTSLLALNADYETIMLASGDTILSNKKLLESCEYIGFECNNCDDASEEDPYLKVVKALKKEIHEENTEYKSSVTVEIYPYRMNASSFVTNIKYLYSSAGSETYFKKRQRVWRGPFTGMVWRWASFDPDRNGVRTYCFNGCKEGFDSNSGLIAFECSSVKHDTDLDTCCDTEDITVRCDLKLPFEGGIKVTSNVSSENGISFDSIDKQKGSSIKTVKEYNGGVIGMHYVRHKDYYFKAKTSKNLPDKIISRIKQKYQLSYR